MKDVESRLVAELMKNSRRSDRELARALRVSQPTVSRMIKRLEAEGAIKEYTMIPNFIELGYKIKAVTLCSLKVSHEEYKGDNRSNRKEPERRAMAENHHV